MGVFKDEPRAINLEPRSAPIVDYREPMYSVSVEQ
jgi:hypothetical protein